MLSIISALMIVLQVYANPPAPLFGPGEMGCLEFSPLTEKSEKIKFGSNCEVQTAPCSTFKIAIAEMGFKSGKLKPSGETFKWDGTKRGREALNKDQDLFSWMKDSVVWVSSIIVNRIGVDQVRLELSGMNYGNASVGPEEFWIKGPLKVSVDEQLQYLSRKTKRLQDAIAILPAESIGGYTVRGKTGSCFVENRMDGPQVGWFVGRAEKAQKDFVFALRFLEQEGHKTDGPAGFRAKELFYNWLKKR